MGIVHSSCTIMLLAPPEATLLFYRHVIKSTFQRFALSSKGRLKIVLCQSQSLHDIRVARSWGFVWRSLRRFLIFWIFTRSEFCCRGLSKAGKSTALVVAGSVIGFAREKDLPNFRTTDTALGELPASFNDMVVP